MSSKKGYLIHFARIFFATFLLVICSSLSHVWNTYQPFQLTFQLQRCQSSLSNIPPPRVNIWHWLNDFHWIHFLPSLSFLLTSMSTKCHSHIDDNYPLNMNKLIGLTHSILVIYLVYHLISLSLFHAQMKQLQEKQRYYTHLYQQDQQHRKSRCSNRLLKT